MSDNPSAALERYMDKLEAYIKPFWPYEWKPWEKYKIRNDIEGNPLYGNANHNLAFGAALAVCAYDLDDSRFRDNPYYPRDLVDYYRKHIRHTRDDWRAQGVGAGMELELPPAPKKIDLAKSKSKNFKRWVELIADGDPDATKAVVTDCGSLRKIKDVQAVFEALSDNAIAIHADIKDDESFETTLQALLASRQLQPWEDSGAAPAAGPERCQYLIDNVSPWLNKRQFSLFAIDMDSDSWGVVVIRNEFSPEFLALSEKLGVAIL